MTSRSTTDPFRAFKALTEAVGEQRQPFRVGKIGPVPVPVPVPLEAPTGPRAYFMAVPPEQARKWLDPTINSRNRTVSEGVVEFYADSMDRGEWKVTGESLQFAGDALSGNCTLMNGQHRLHAIDITDQAVTLLIVDHLDPTVFAVLDTGKTRGFKDVLSAEGHRDTSKIAAAIRLAFQVDHDMVTGHGGAKTRVSHSQLQKYFEENEDLATFISEAGALRRTTGITMSAALVAAWKFNTLDPDMAHEFLDGLKSGANLDPRDPRLALRRWLDRNARKTRASVHLAITYKAWNAYRTGRVVEVLRWSYVGESREKFPVPV